MIKGLNHINYFAQDLKRAQEFYTQILGLELIFAGDDAFAVELGGGNWMVVAEAWRENLPPGGGCVMVLWVDDIEQVVADLKAKGVTVLRDVFDLQAGLFAVIQDSEGNAIKLYEGDYGGTSL